MAGKKLIIIMANTDPANEKEVGAPIFQASVAAAMNYEVEVICTASAARLLKKGVAEKIFMKEGERRSIYDFIKDAHAAGVKFYCCSPGLDLFDMQREDLIPECNGVVGAAHFIEEIMSGNGKVLTY
jgi:predicted peroxiredoxin